jgi:hypothetical protein
LTAYRNHQYALLIAVVAVLFACASLVAGIVRDGSTGARFGPVVPVVLLSAFCLLRLARAGVYADDEGIRVLNPLRTVRIPWEQVDHFSLRPYKGFPSVGFAELVDGGRVQMWGIQARSYNTAAKRVPEELIEALNRRLQESRRAPLPTP